ncbi:PEP-CTERM sorting domain-containing protein [Aquabacterium parvum]|jgi:hypothetical protein|uniref:PEP-CTERM sorting domain-containing protein n=1 Tax=Aquabacterium parvum TaxID=70584 RepID=UPI0009F8FC89|nr:PEP-CTERM sorting domain-containing protein [Aquabacterium parvum]MBU0914854.1 PEP-CTERM sorting domain-containing protein [Gammaproteobacteria bacterium]
MKHQPAWVAAAAALLLTSGAHAGVYPPGEYATLEAGAQLALNGLAYSDLSGAGRLEFSAQWLRALNGASVGLQALPPALLQTSASSGAATGLGYQSATVSVPVQSWFAVYRPGSGLFGTDETALGTTFSGGFMLTSAGSGATGGSGELRISDLRVDHINRVIHADIEGANGVGFLNDHPLWTYERVIGDTQREWPDLDRLDGTQVHQWDLSLSGLFLVNQADVGNIFAKALNLNDGQRLALQALNDPNTNGFGSLSYSAEMVVTVIPEPGTWALMGAGLVCLAALRRRETA